MDNTDEKRDRERDEFERHRERDEERDRERQTDGSRGRDAMSRRVTGAESQTQPRGAVGTKRMLHEGASGGTPPKRLHPEIVSSRAHITMGARAHEPGDRYRGTEPPELGRGGQVTATQHSASDRVHVSIERRRLFTNDVIDMETVADIFIGAAEEVQPAEISELIAVMNPQQLASSL